jgi:FkbM family methyltransferase
MIPFTVPSNLKLRPGTSDGIVHHQIFMQEIYSPVLGLRPSYALIIDGGANCGCSRVWFRNNFPDETKTRIISYEPDAESWMAAKGNAADVRTEQEDIIRAALWGTKGRGSFSNPGAASFALSVTPSDDGPLMLTELGPVLGPRPCLVKLDIEGAETSLFQNPHWLDMVDVLAVELHGPEAASSLAAALQNQRRKYRRGQLGETTVIDFME